MLNSYKTREDKMQKETSGLEQYIYSFAKKFGYEKWVKYDEHLKRYFPTDKMEDDLRKYIDRYNDRQMDLRTDFF